MKKFLILPALALALTACNSDSNISGGNGGGKPTYYDPSGRWDLIVATTTGLPLPAFDLASFQVTSVSSNNDFEASTGYNSAGQTLTNKTHFTYASGNTKTGHVQLQGNITDDSMMIYGCDGAFNPQNNTYHGICNKSKDGKSTIELNMVRR